MRFPRDFVKALVLVLAVSLSLSAVCRVRSSQQRLTEVNEALVESQQALSQLKVDLRGMSGKRFSPHFGEDVDGALAFLKFRRSVSVEFASALADAAATTAELDADPSRLSALCDRYVADPSAPDALDLAAILVSYAQDSSKVDLTLNSDVVDILRKQSGEISPLELVLFTVALLRWAVQHDGKAGTDEASNAAGLETVARGCRNVLEVVAGGSPRVAKRVTSLSPDAMQAFVHYAVARSRAWAD